MFFRSSRYCRPHLVVHFCCCFCWFETSTASTKSTWTVYLSWSFTISCHLRL